MKIKTQKNSHWLFEKLASLGKMAAQLRGPLKILQYDSAVMYGGVQRGPDWGPMMPDTPVSRTDSDKSDRCCFPVRNVYCCNTRF